MSISTFVRKIGLTAAAMSVVASGLSGAQAYAAGTAAIPLDHGFNVSQDWVDCDLIEDAEVRYARGSETYTVALQLQGYSDYLDQAKIKQGEKVILTDPNKFDYKETRNYEVVAFNKKIPAFVVGSFSDTAPTKKYCADQPPIAKNDHRIVGQNETIVIAVLRNDTDPEGQVLKIDSLREPERGTARIVEDGTKVEYTPGLDDCNGDLFAYSVVDPAGNRDAASIEVNVDRSSGPCHG